MTPRWGALTLVAGLVAIVAAQEAVQVRITAPAPGALVSGTTTLTAQILPASGAARVKRFAFSVDGREVCVLTAPPFSCDWDAGGDVVEHLVRAVAWLQDGSRITQSVRTRGLGYVDKVNVDAVQFTVVVTDKSGRFVENLPRTAFRVYEDDQRQTLSTFAASNVPLELVAALDVSQSMTPAMDSLKQAARTFLSSLGSGEQVTLLAFNDNIFTLARKTTSSETKLRAVDRLAPWGGTALYDVIIRGIELLGRQSGRRALMVFSDGEDQSSRSTLEMATSRVESSDATIYAVGLGRATQTGPLHDLLQRIATVSGGRGMFTDQRDELQRMFQEIFDDLSHQYLVGYQPTNQKRDGAWRKIRVEVGEDYTVRHRQGYRLLPER
jgi:Ca-activated chloride channel family protein